MAPWKGALRQAVGVCRGLGHVPGMLWRSSGEIGGAVSSWIRAGKQSKKTANEDGGLLSRLLVLCVLGYVLVYLAGHQPWLWDIYVGAWLALCLVLARRRDDLPKEAANGAQRGRWSGLRARWGGQSGDPEEDPQGSADTPGNDHETLGEEDPEKPDAGNAEDERARRIALIWERVEHAVAAAVQAGTRGVRTADLLTEFQSGGTLHDWDEKRFRDMLRGIEIPVRDQMYFRVNGEKKNLPGVHVEDLSNSLGRAPRLPSHLVPDLTATHPLSPALSLVKDDPPRQGPEGAA